MPATHDIANNNAGSQYGLLYSPFKLGIVYTGQGIIFLEYIILEALRSAHGISLAHHYALLGGDLTDIALQNG